MITHIANGIYTGAFKDISGCHVQGLSAKNVADVRHIVDKAGNEISYILEAIDTAKDIFYQHGKVLIACDMGISRSRVVAIGLLAELGNSIEDAISVVLTSANNPEINPDLLLLLRNFYKSKDPQADTENYSADTGAVVLGSNGFVGAALLKCLKEERIDSVGLSRSDVNIKTELVKLITALESLKQPTVCLLYTSPSPRDGLLSRMPSSA